MTTNKTVNPNEQERGTYADGVTGMRVEFGLPRYYNQGALLNALDDMCCTFRAFRDISDDEMADVLEMYSRRKRRDAE